MVTGKRAELGPESSWTGISVRRKSASDAVRADVSSQS
jgi:hypothetical protein